MDRETQCDRILGLLRAHAGEWVGLPEILDLRIGQYNARIHYLRRAGHNIEMRSSYCGRVRHTWYKLVANGN